MDRMDFRTYVVISIWFGCNNDCRICMLGEMKRRLPGIDFDGFRRVTTAIRREGRFENLILSGGEVTTFGDLEAFARWAASLGWFKRIQIQTNGRRLCDGQYVRRLLASGINEFFVSVYGPEAVHDAVTGVPGSFCETMEGLAHLAEASACVASNTVLTTANVRHIPRLLRALAASPVSEMQLWNFFPMERTDRRNLVVGLPDLLGMLEELAPVAREAGKPVVLKAFPECLPLPPPLVVDNHFPGTVLPDPFWCQFSENGYGWCAYRERCASRTCWGLSSAYVQKYGDAGHLLSPRRPAGVAGFGGALPGEAGGR